MELREWNVEDDLKDVRDVIEYLKVVYAEGDAFDVRTAALSVIREMSTWPEAASNEAAVNVV